jgi:membrane-bound lytic murein transglycosylase F
MKNVIVKFLMFFALLLFGMQCSFFKKEEKDLSQKYLHQPVAFDLEEIVQRGFIRAVVANSSTSYYIYRGRRMGYEFELLRNLASTLGVRLHLIVESDIDEAILLLNSGKADVVAMNLVKSPEREDLVGFTQSFHEVGTVLVQKKPLQASEDLQFLQGEVIDIPSGTFYTSVLSSVQAAQNVEFSINQVKEDTEVLISKIVAGDIKYTVADKDVALVNATYFADLDVSVELGQSNKVGWAIRKNAPDLENAINQWINKKSKSGYLSTVYAKYFLNAKNSYFRNSSTFSSLGGNKISPYDDIIKRAADGLGWDWRLLAALVYKESQFDTSAVSYAGAVGLLQLMPVTLERFGVENANDPYQSLMGGVKYLKYLDKFWRQRVPSSNERLKFILASYNIGHGHVEDAWRLTLKHGENSTAWRNVSQYLKRKSQKEFYTDPVVKSGFAKGHIAVSYVEDVILLYDSYRTLVNP